MRIEYPRVRIELRPSPIDGVGVFAVDPIARGKYVADGIEDEDYERLISWEHFEQFDKDVQEKINQFCIGMPEGFIPPEGLDFNRLSVEWFLNHSCDGNVGFNDTGDFVARRQIRKDEELTYDYALAESNPHFKMVCKCGSQQHCRKIVTGDDWKDREFRRLNHAYLLPRLRSPVLAPQRSESLPGSVRSRRAVR